MILNTLILETSLAVLKKPQNLLTTYYPKITGRVQNYAGIVTTSDPHGLFNGDKIKFTVLPSREENIKFRFILNIFFNTNQISI